MNDHFELVLSRLKNMLTRIATNDADFDDLCERHAALTADIRKLNPGQDPAQAERDRQLRQSRAALEQEMFAIMQANTRV